MIFLLIPMRCRPPPTGSSGKVSASLTNRKCVFIEALQKAAALGRLARLARWLTTATSFALKFGRGPKLETGNLLVSMSVVYYWCGEQMRSNVRLEVTTCPNRT